MRGLWLVTAAAGGCLFAGHGSVAAPGGEPPDSVSSGRSGFVRPAVPKSWFTHEKSALIEPECERIATMLARHAAFELTGAVLRGETAARNRGRLLLTISLHLHPRNAPAMHCSQRWADGQAPSLPPPAENLRLFSNFLLRAAGRQSDKPGPGPDALARVLIRLAADLDPANEEAVLASELQDRDGREPPLRALLAGTFNPEER